jgi:hypothetical protein
VIPRKRELTVFITEWLPQIRPLIKSARLAQLMQLIMTVDNKTIADVIMETRRLNMGERVPDEYKKRNDFLLENEMEIATNTIANRFGINLQPFYAFYRKDIRDCKHSLI